MQIDTTTMGFQNRSSKLLQAAVPILVVVMLPVMLACSKWLTASPTIQATPIATASAVAMRKGIAPQAGTVRVFDQKLVDPELRQFFPNGHGQPVGKEPIKLEMPGNLGDLTLKVEVVDVEHYGTPSLRVVLVRNPDGVVSDQIVSIKTFFYQPFPANAVLSEIDGSGNRGLFIPVESGMRFVRYLVLAWDPVSRSFMPLKGADLFPLDIDGVASKTATLINPQVEDDALLHESHAGGSGPEFVRCSRITKDGYQTIFEGNYNHDIKNGVAGDWRLEISEPKAKISEKPRRSRMVKTTVFSSAQIGDESPGLNCSDWLEKLRSLRRPANERKALAKRPIMPKVTGT